MDTADHLRDASPWRAEPDHVKLAVLGKLAEELGELQAAVARCIIQGVDGCHPVTGKPNRDWLHEEMVDVRNMLGFVAYAAGLTSMDDLANGQIRMEKKRDHIKNWIQQIRTPAPP